MLHCFQAGSKKYPLVNSKFKPNIRSETHITSYDYCISSAHLLHQQPTRIATHTRFVDHLTNIVALHPKQYKPQSREARMWLDLYCSKACSRRAPAVEKAPIGRAAAVAARRAAVVSARRHLERSHFTASSRSAVPVELSTRSPSRNCAARSC